MQSTGLIGRASAGHRCAAGSSRGHVRDQTGARNHPNDGHVVGRVYFGVLAANVLRRRSGGAG
ncbi:hypothetical protein [Micromonospora sp. DT41]|uniref:hypothetical protein n=1 Tax=Micromonospora sp. DT41 TaxID=3393437 RepID=UPI003CF7EE7D